MARMRIGCQILLVASTACFFLTGAQANVGLEYGMSSRGTALGGAQVTLMGDAFGAYANPATLPLLGQKRLLFSYGLLDIQPNFTPISGIVVENNYSSDKTPTRVGDADTSYRGTFGQLLGVTYLLSDESPRLAIGIVGFLPINQVDFFDTGDPYAPEYILYRDRTQRPQLDLALGYQLLSRLSVGAGLHFGFAVTGSATAFLQTREGKPSTLRLASSTQARAAPYFGLQFLPFATSVTEPGPTAVGVVVRQPLNSPIHLSVNAAARLADLAAPDVHFDSTSSAAYDPLTVQLGFSHAYLPSTKIYVQLDYQAWSRFESSVPTLQNTAGVSFSPSSNPSFPFRNIWIPRVGHEFEWGDWVLRAGYAYRPSVLDGLPNGPGNFLDPPKHRFNLGVGKSFSHFLTFAAPCNVDLAIDYERLITQQIVKTPGNEGGDLTDSKIGAPGYEAGGKILGAEVSLSLAF